jgi:hypothetical protein
MPNAECRRAEISDRARAVREHEQLVLTFSI